MKNLSRILTVVLCCAPFAYAGAAGQVATTSGSNLTAYNPSNANNNQWATMTNGRYDGPATTAKADFGGCNAVVLRCAQPKCGNGGCADYTIAQKIVEGCVKSNKSCKKYGEDLIETISAQLVASASSKINEQQMALEAARIQAEAQANAAASSAQSQQMELMQQQMQQMQQQMAQQQEESARQLQQALTQQAQQQQQALDEMKTAATQAGEKSAAGVEDVPLYQQEAIARGISNDVLARQTLTGQIETQVKDAKTNLTKLKKALNDLFEYGHCDTHGNNCSGPTRMKKWRELAHAFIDPYDAAVEDIYNALMDATMAGVDISQIYLMLDNSCNQWAQFACPKGDRIEYTYDGDKPTEPKSCGALSAVKEECLRECVEKTNSASNPYKSIYDLCVAQCDAKEDCRPCTPTKMLTGGDDVYYGWVNQEEPQDNGNTTVIACYSGVLAKNKLFSHMMNRRGGTGMVNIETLERWINQVEPDKKYKEGPDPKAYCFTSDTKTKLQSTALSKSLKDDDICVKGPDGDKFKNETDPTCPYIHANYAICDTHKRNNGDAGDANDVKEMLGLKVTVLSQQLYKQYEYLEATIRRLEIQINKAMVKINLEAAGAESDGSSSSLAGGKNKNSDYRDCSGKTKQATLDCLRENYSALMAQINNKKCGKDEQAQITYDLAVMDNVVDDNSKLKKDECNPIKNVKQCENCLKLNYSGNMSKLDKEIRDDESNRYGNRR